MVNASGQPAFSPPPVTEVSCVALQIDNADILDRKTSYKYNATVRYKCWTGYRIEGSDLLTCKKNEWNPPPPKCNSKINQPCLGFIKPCMI